MIDLEPYTLSSNTESTLNFPNLCFHIIYYNIPEFSRIQCHNVDKVHGNNMQCVMRKEGGIKEGFSGGQWLPLVAFSNSTPITHTFNQYDSIHENISCRKSVETLDCAVSWGKECSKWHSLFIPRVKSTVGFNYWNGLVYSNKSLPSMFNRKCSFLIMITSLF